MKEEEKWKLRFERERAIRKEAEQILEEKSLELYNLNKVLQGQKDELETIFQTTVEGIVILDLKANFLFFNKAYEVMTGYTKSELLGKNCIELTMDENKDLAKQSFESVIEKGYLENLEKECIRKDGEHLMVNMSIAMMPDKQSLLVTVKDITEIKSKEKQIKDYVNLIDQNIITSTTNLQGTITYASNAFCEMSGYSKDELIGKNHRIIRHSDMSSDIFKDMWNSISNDKPWTGEIKNLKKDGSYYWVEANISPIFDENNKKIGYTAIRQDITNKKKIEEISITDGLTKIYNRRHFNNQFPETLRSSKRDNSLVSFIIMDIDYFKQYNDTYGHQMGDDALIKVANTIQRALQRADDYCFRLGGEEFGVIFKSISKEKSLAFANSIKNSIEHLNIEHSLNTASKYLTISIGLVCEYANTLKDEDELYKQADDLLYKAKESGRNQVCSNIGE